MKKLIVSVSLLAGSVFANPWTECGLGGAIGSLIEGESASKVIATITNVTFDLGTTATTSAVSSPDLCANDKVAAAKLITDTYASLEVETANGKGENLQALMDILNVQESARTDFVKSLRTAYTQEIMNSNFVTLSYDQKVQVYYNVLMNVAAKQA